VRYTNLRCPACNHQFDDFMQVGEEDKYVGPRPGSIGVCIECGDLHVFQRNGSIRSLTRHEYIEALQKSPYLKDTLSALRKVHEEERDGHGL
jgi:hypothetical protein